MRGPSNPRGSFRVGGHGGGSGRGVARLVADFGHQLPPHPIAPTPLAPAEVFTEVISGRGRRERAAGWAPVGAPLSTWRMTSEQVGECGR